MGDKMSKEEIKEILHVAHVDRGHLYYIKLIKMMLSKNECM